MGDRTLVICVDDGGDITPAVYAHHLGSDTADLIREVAPRLREGDPSYSIAAVAAHFWKAADSGHGYVSVGILPAPDKIDEATLRGDYNHGDAGVWVINVDTGNVQQYKASYSSSPAQNFWIDLGNA